MIVAPHGRGFGHYAVGLLLNVIIFAVIGPAFGAFLVCVFMLIFFICASSSGAWSALPGTLAAMPLMLIVAFPIGYVIATPAAIVAGFLVAIATSVIRHPLWLYAFAAGAGAASAALIRPLAPAFPGFDSALLAAPGALAALFCTRMARPFRLAPTAPLAPAGGAP